MRNPGNEMVESDSIFALTAFGRRQALDWTGLMFGRSRAPVTSTRILGNTSGSPIVQTIKTEAQGPTAGARGGRASNPG